MAKFAFPSIAIAALATVLVNAYPQAVKVKGWQRLPHSEKPTLEGYLRELTFEGRPFTMIDRIIDPLYKLVASGKNYKLGFTSGPQQKCKTEFHVGFSGNNKPEVKEMRCWNFNADELYSDIAS